MNKEFEDAMDRAIAIMRMRDCKCLINPRVMLEFLEIYENEKGG
jgi:hypothetical protein